MSVSSVGLDAGVCFVSRAVLSLSLYDTLNKDKTHTCTHTHVHKTSLCSPVKTSMNVYESVYPTEEEVIEFEFIH